MFTPLLVSHGAAHLVYPHLFTQFSCLANFPIFGVTAKFLLCWKLCIILFAGCTGWISSGYASTMGTLICYALVNGFDWDAFLIWVIYCFTCWSFFGTTPWIAPSEILLGGLLFWIFPLGISMLPCADFMVVLVVLMVLDYVGYKWNPVRRVFLHLWRKLLACWIVLGKTLLCLVLIPLLFLGCMPYGVCSVPLMILCTIHILHVVPMMIYGLDDCVLLSLFLVGQRGCSCNIIIQKCGCRLIGKE